MRIWKIISAASAILAIIAEFQAVLQALAADDYGAATELVIDRVPLTDEEVTAFRVIGPKIMAAVDKAIPEEKLLRLLG